MSAPLIWIVFPIMISLLLIIFGKNTRIVAVIAAFSSLILCLIALLIPNGIQNGEGLFLLKIEPELEVLGRQFFLPQEDNLLLVLIYGFGAIWFAGSLINETSKYFPSLGMAFLALLIAAASVDPFLYAALLIEVAVLVCIPLLIRPGSVSNRGIFRFLIFQTLGMIFILLSGWFLAGGEIAPVSELQLIQAVALLGLGFAFWLAIFPLHTWIPMLIENVRPYSVGFVLSYLSFVGIIMLLEFLNRFTWLREFIVVYPALRYLGVLMIVFAGFWSLFQKNLERIFAYALIYASGSSLINIGCIPDNGIYAYAARVLPNFLGILLISWSMQLLLTRHKSLRLAEITGLADHFPFTVAAFLSGIFTISGLPLSPNYLANTLMLDALSNYSVDLASITLLGTFFLTLTSFRLSFRFLSSTQSVIEGREHIFEKITLAFFICLVIILGFLTPNFLYGMKYIFKGLKFLL
ncbi:MAG TPA: hypothetical protein G4N92_01125 [Anaerolineae bacterium]|nr:hypothetical protein [Anaerolineae bacterium]